MARFKYRGIVQDIYGNAISLADVSVYLQGPKTLTASTGASGTLNGTYYYVVQAQINGDWSYQSPEASATVDGGSSAGTISLSWDSVPNASLYRVWRGTESGSWDRYWETSDTTFTDDGSHDISGEVIGSGDGSTTSFSGTFASPPVVPNTVSIHYTIGGTAYTATDDGAGNISGTDCSGTVTYDTGSWSLTFSTAPDDSTNITADYGNGTGGSISYSAKVYTNEDETTATTTPPQVQSDSYGVYQFWVDSTDYDYHNEFVVKVVYGASSSIETELALYLIGANAEKLGGNDPSYYANNTLSNVSDSTVLDKVKNVDGSGSGLDADLLDGYNTTTALTANSIPITDANGYLNTFINQGSGSGLDADKVDGYQTATGVTASSIPVTDANGYLNLFINQGSGSGLDADKTDGYDVGNSSGQIPLSNSTLCTDLNADKLDGYDAVTSPTANQLLVLDANAKFPNSVLYTGSGNGLDADTVDGYQTATTVTASSIPVTDANGYLNTFINQGSGSGLDSDKVDGYDVNSTPTAGTLLPLDSSAKFPNSVLYTGSGNGLDADKVDGYDASHFLAIDNSTHPTADIDWGGYRITNSHGMQFRDDTYEVSLGASSNYFFAFPENLFDNLAFKFPTSAQYDDGGTWYDINLDDIKDLFVPQIPGIYIISNGWSEVRFEWNNMEYIHADWLCIWTSTAGSACAMRIIIEASSDGSTWTTTLDTNNAISVGAPGVLVYRKHWHNEGLTPYLRLRIIPTWNDTTSNIELYKISLVSGVYPHVNNSSFTKSRMPLYWDVSKNVTMEGGLDVDSGTLYVDASSGNVGIGTTSPNYKLDVAGTIGINGNYLYTSPNAFLKEVTNTADTSEVALGRRSTGQNYILSIGNSPSYSDTELHLVRAGSPPNEYLRFLAAAGGPSGYNNVFRIESVAPGSYVRDIVFAARDTGTPSLTDILTLKSNGNVGIGTTGPNARLTVITTSAFNQFSLVNSAYYSGGWARGGDLQFIKDDGTKHRGLTYGIYGGGNTLTGAYFSAIEDDSSPWSTAQLFLHSSGNVGIGTASPGTKLDVYDSATTEGTTAQFFRNTGDGVPSQVLIGRSASSGGSGILKFFNDLTTSSNAFLGFGVYGDTLSSSTFQGLVIKKGGNVGIGTTSPQQRLTLSSGSNFVIDMAIPTGVTTTLSSSGTLNGTYYYKVSASDGVGWTEPSAEVSGTVDGGSTNGTITVSWNAVTGAAKYRVYRGTTAGGEDRYWEVTSTSFVDDGSHETTGEVIGSGDGSTTSFSGTLANPPVVANTVAVHYTISGTAYTATDDGAGNISGTDCSGTITYSTGAWSLTFSTAPDDSTNITADYDTGTAGTPPTVTTAYINKFTASGNSWLLGGNVGIGTTDPAYKLDVNGDIRCNTLYGSVPDSSVTQAKLKTSIGSVGTADLSASSSANYTLPGGEYGFYPQISIEDTYNVDTYIGYHHATSGSYVTNVAFLNNESDHSPAVYAQQRYVTSSGEVFWIFLLRDKSTGKIIGGYQAPDHPCFGNGSDPILVPHPFGNYDPEKHEIIVINPSSDDVKKMKHLCKPRRLGEHKKELLSLFMGEKRNGKFIPPICGFDENVEMEYPNEEITIGIVEDEDDRPLWFKEEAKIIKVNIRDYQPDMVKVRPFKWLKRKRIFNL